MVLPVTNTEFATQFAELLGLSEEDTADFVLMVESWNGPSRAELARQMSDFVAKVTTQQTQISDWLAGTADGGPDDDGKYPILLIGGGTVYLDSPAAMKAGIAKGDPAKIDFGIGWQYTLASGERIGGISMVSAGTYSPAASKGHVETAPTANAVITIKKNNAAWGTATFLAGQNDATFVIASPTVVAGDRISFHGPSPADATMADGEITIAGV